MQPNAPFLESTPPAIDPDTGQPLLIASLPRLEPVSMAEAIGNLWEYNLVKVIVVDVTDDYALMQPPMPSDFYPVLAEQWLPRHSLDSKLPNRDILEGYCYDWHERPPYESGSWYVGVVRQDFAEDLLSKASA